MVRALIFNMDFPNTSQVSLKYPNAPPLFATTLSRYRYEIPTLNTCLKTIYVWGSKIIGPQYTGSQEKYCTSTYTFK